MIAGLEEVSGGVLYFDQVPVNEQSPAERDVAMVFQSYALYPHMSVFENIAFPLRVRKEPAEKIRAQVNQVAALLDLDGLLMRRPKELSGGQRQRVALGRAIIRRPKVFLMDEPLSNLDAKLRIEMRGELKRLHRQLQITMVYVTHDQEEAMVLSDRIAVLYQGHLQQCGRPMEIYSKPANLFVAGFIGSPPMNIIDGPGVKELFALIPSLQQLKRENIIVGIRPYDIRVCTKGDAADLLGEVILLEPTGSDLWVDVHWKGTRIKGMAERGAKIVPGDEVFLKISSDMFHIFDQKTHKRLL
jgi:multiple sugar transport system ATP-binding protein